MKKNRAQNDILRISISVFIVVALWLGFNIYHAFVNTTIEPNLQLQILPIDSSFNSESLNKLKSRQKIAPLYQIDSASGSAEINPSAPTTIPAQLNPSTTPTESFSIPGQ